MHFVVSVENYGDDLFLQKAQIDLEIVAVMADQPGSQHLGLVDVFVIVVVLDQSEGVVDSRARNEGGADPVMDQTTWYFHGPSTGPELRRNLTRSDLPGPRGIHLVPEERTRGLQGLFGCQFGRIDVRIKGLNRPRPQLQWVCSLGHRARQPNRFQASCTWTTPG